MKKIVIILIGLFVVSLTNAQTKNVLKTQEDSVSYCIGQNIGTNLKDPNMKINFDLLIKGVKDASTNAKSILTEEVMQKVMMEFNQRLMAKRSEEMNAAKEKNKKAGIEFLEANKKKEGVKVLESGLQYIVLVEGQGPSPTKDDKVKVHYRGTLIDGKEFDSSYSRNEPAVFGVSQVIKGWTEALQLMKAGSKWMLYIPSELAYGDSGAGDVIGPGSVLIFEVELIEIVN
ncbi:MAG: FKBP-type peptidyl-prolyl cis-trans isomerase [Ignavibacteria bacterium]|nr:FKBP-type peptidyl-prolyl cis-trans isomerase [Ignavibacteria bacterium]